MSRSAADMMSADGSGERLLSLRLNLDKTPMHAHGTWRSGGEDASEAAAGRAKQLS